MSRRRAGLAREVKRRQHQEAKATLVLVPEMMAPVLRRKDLEDALAPLPDEFRWTGWGYLLPEVSRLVDEPTGYYSVVELVSGHSFAELSGQVAS